MRTLLQRRNRDFMVAFRRVASTLMGEGQPTVADIIRKVLEGDAPAFYVGFEYAYSKVCRIISGRNRAPTTLRGRLWHDLGEKVQAIMQDYPKMTIADALMKVLETSRAPSFYLRFDTALRLYYRIKHYNRYDVRVHRLRRNSMF